MWYLGRAVRICLLAVVLAGCSSAGGGVAPSRGAIAEATPRTSGSGHIYVGESGYEYYGNADVLKYDPGKTRILGSNGYVYDPVAIVFDGQGDTYVANWWTGRLEHGSVQVFGNENITITKNVNAPWALALDSQHNLYVANTGGDLADAVTVFAPHSDQLLFTITQGVVVPDALKFDTSGNLYVSNLGYPSSVTVYAPGGNLLERTIVDGVQTPVALAFDGSGNLYVANRNANTVTVYSPGATKVAFTISEGVRKPAAIEFDTSGNLYVANDAPKRGSVSVYAPGSQTPKQTITLGVNNPIALTFDDAGRLYVANAYDDVVIYGPGRTAPSKRIHGYIWQLNSLVFGP